MLQELSKEHLHRMNIGRRYWGAEFKNVPDLPHKVMLEKYIENYVQMFREGWGFFLICGAITRKARRTLPRRCSKKWCAGARPLIASSPTS